ncbi:PREDICTED: uncharacterized protein LOC105556230, partial [Vollenhovia emeryi]|uniref:uncharacterized protein LOC105556230 n=1 Tax=Vollenhovia emeryi TaxID=411798 RepID=UPI0005F45686
MFLHDFLHLTYDYAALIRFLCEKGVIRDRITCPKCSNIIELDFDDKSLKFKCRNKYYVGHYKKKKRRVVCTFGKSALAGTWFSHGHHGIVKTCRFIAYFLMIRPPRQIFLEEQLCLSRHSVVDWTNFCRELLQQWIIADEELLGGSGVIVEIDEAKVGKRKYNRGRIVKGQWVFGAIERVSGKMFIVPVKDRTSITLVDIVKRRIAPGSIIYSDCWRAYDTLSNYDYTHYVVNQTEHFVDSQTGIHTQNIERLWRDMRGALPRF